MKRIFVVDDHPMMRRGYTALIAGEPDLAVAGEAGSAREALAALSKDKPDLVLADISLGGANGIGMARQLLSWYPDLPVLVVSMHDEVLYAERALQAGAHGYIMKSVSDEALLGAIRHVLGGHVYLSPAMQDRVLFQHVGPAPLVAAGDGEAGLQALSDRELEVFELLGQGHSTDDIAGMLSISVKTVQSHQGRIKKKLGVGSLTEVRRQAIQWVEALGEPRRGGLEA